MKKLFVIGIGAGDPDFVTVQAINALKATDVFFVIDKGEAKAGLVRVREEICTRHIPDPSYRTVEIDDPVRDRKAAAYGAAVEAWRGKRAAAYREAISQSLEADERGAFLVWGDPSIYDGTLAILDRILTEDPGAFEYEVIPGISSVQALAARHGIALNRIGKALMIAPGRLLADGMPEGIDDVVVMLDSRDAYRGVSGDVDIYWGAYLGTPDEILISGSLAEVSEEIARVRTAAKADMGWIMDIYLLRRKPQTA